MAPRFLALLTGRNLPKIRKPREPEASIINERRSRTSRAWLSRRGFWSAELLIRRRRLIAKHKPSRAAFARLGGKRNGGMVVGEGAPAGAVALSKPVTKYLPATASVCCNVLALQIWGFVTDDWRGSEALEDQQLSQVDKDREELDLLLRGFQVSRMLRLIADLGIADKVPMDGQVTVQELAATCAVLTEPLLRVLRTLASFKIFQLSADGAVAHTSRSRLLRTDTPNSLHHAARFWTAR